MEEATPNIRLYMISDQTYAFFGTLTQTEAQALCVSVEAAAQDYLERQEFHDRDSVRICFEMDEGRYLRAIAYIHAVFNPPHEPLVEVFIREMEWLGTDDFLDHLSRNRGNMSVKRCNFSPRD